MAWEKILNSKIKFADFFDYPFRKQDKLSYLKTYHSISKAVIKIISEEEPEFVIGPMGIGDHTDHVIVNQTLINLKEKHDFTLYLYEDFPYANQEKYYFIQTLDMLRKKTGLSPFYIDITELLKDKVSLNIAYRSQYENSIDEMMDKFTRYGKALGLEGIYMNRLLDRERYYERIWHVSKNKLKDTDL